MISKTPVNLKVAVLRNYATPAQWGQYMADSWVDAIRHFDPDSQIDFFSPIDGGGLPSAEEYNLIALTGGVFNLMLEEHEPWVVQTLDFLRTTAQQHPEVKILGICWGHQAVAHAFGGTVGVVESGPCVGIQEIKLTDEGEKFFSGKNREVKDAVNLHKFHKRCVVAPAPNFIPLATNNEILLSASSNILTFQGHVEMTDLVATALLDADQGAYTGGKTKEAVEQIYQSVKKNHDGYKLFAKIMEWIGTPSVTASS